MRLSIAEALRKAIREEMQRDETVFCLGEDIGVPGGFGGAFTVTLGLEKDFRDRIIDTPISENGIFGAACGAAIMGMRPIADVQYGDFMLCAMDQIVNQIAKLRYMSGGKLKVPVVMRAPVGVTGRGAQHAQCLEPYFITCPGIKIVAPSTAYDAYGLLKAAVRDDDPVLIFEHKLLYGSKGARSESGGIDASSEISEEDFTVPIGKGIIRREGDDITIIGSLLMMHHSIQAADILKKEKISCEIIDPRSLWPLDMDLILNSVKKTGRVVIVEESPKQGGIGAEISAQISESIPDYLLSPITRVAAPNTPAPFSPVMEKFYIPQPERIAVEIRNLLAES
ncbi:MAG: alpha-ketoacid dehydrogenase subunit beta [Actinobacteria bacterium]|nr:alpha-ketoacid dehydrogenase subunit beta [Actinomycetota bacterium]